MVDNVFVSLSDNARYANRYSKYTKQYQVSQSSVRLDNIYSMSSDVEQQQIVTRRINAVNESIRTLEGRVETLLSQV